MEETQPASDVSTPAAEPKAKRSLPRRLARAALRIALLSYVGLAGLLYFFQSHLVYHPPKVVRMTPAKIGLKYEEIRLGTSDGVNLSAWFIPSDANRGVVLYNHGNGDNVGRLLERIEIFHELGLGTLVYDYRGYGQSEGEPTEEGTYLDSRAAWKYLVDDRKVPADRIVIWGQSLGGPIAAHLAKETSPAALVLESTFTSIPELGGDLFWFLPVKYLVRFQYDTAGSLRELHCPVLVIHSRHDNLIPFHHGQRLFELAKAPKQFLEIDGPHGDGFINSQRIYEKGIDTFMNENMDR